MVDHCLVLLYTLIYETKVTLHRYHNKQLDASVWWSLVQELCYCNSVRNSLFPLAIMYYILLFHIHQKNKTEVKIR